LLLEATDNPSSALVSSAKKILAWEIFSLGPDDISVKGGHYELIADDGGIDITSLADSLPRK